MELLDIVDENGIPTGEVVEREKAHREGVRHRTSHVWIARKRDGRVEILLQKRSQDKDSHPGCYDISSAGHIPAGVDFIPSALRELKEELGIEANPEELIYCGVRKGMYEDVFYVSWITRLAMSIFCGKMIWKSKSIPFRNQKSKVSALWNLKLVMRRWRKSRFQTALP